MADGQPDEPMFHTLAEVIRAVVREEVRVLLHAQQTEHEEQFHGLDPLQIPPQVVPFDGYHVDDATCARIVELTETNDCSIEEAAGYVGVYPSLAVRSVHQYLARHRYWAGRIPRIIREELP